MSRRPFRAEKLTLSGPAGALECLLEDTASEAPVAAGVVCHPHPLHGGTMQNKVVHTLARGFHDLGVPTVRFNYRGVGASEGSYADGVGETGDAVAVLDWVSGRWPDAPLWLGGFSFGAGVALQASALRELQWLVTVAPPAGRRSGGQKVTQPQCPWLIIHGEEDELVDCDSVVAWVNELGPGPELIVLPGVDHYFHGRLRDLREAIVAGLGGRSAVG